MSARISALSEIFIGSCSVEQLLMAQTRSDAEGRYAFREVQLPVNREEERSLQGSFEIFGMANGFGFTWSPQKWYHPEDEVGEDPRWGEEDRRRSYGKGDAIEVDLRFPAPARLRGRILDDDGNPVAGARVGLWNAERIDEGGYDTKGPFHRVADDAFSLLYVSSAMPEKLRTILMPGTHVLGMQQLGATVFPPQEEVTCKSGEKVRLRFELR